MEGLRRPEDVISSLYKVLGARASPGRHLRRRRTRWRRGTRPAGRDVDVMQNWDQENSRIDDLNNGRISPTQVQKMVVGFYHFSDFKNHFYKMVVHHFHFPGVNNNSWILVEWYKMYSQLDSSVFSYLPWSLTTCLISSRHKGHVGGGGMSGFSLKK